MQWAKESEHIQGGTVVKFNTVYTAVKGEMAFTKCRPFLASTCPMHMLRAHN